MKQVVKFLSCFFRKTLFLLLLTLHIALASNYPHDVNAVYEAMTSGASNGSQILGSQDNYNSISNLDISAALKNNLNALSMASNNNSVETNTLTKAQRENLIYNSTECLKNQIDIMHNLMLNLAAIHKQQSMNGKKSLAPNIQITMQEFLKTTAQNPESILSSHTIHYILRSFKGTESSDSPYNGFMIHSSVRVNSSQVLSELFPNKENVTHLEIIQKLEELEQKAMHGSITAKEIKYIQGLSIGLSGQLHKFITMFGNQITIEKEDLKESHLIAKSHLDQINDQLSNAADREILNPTDYHYETTIHDTYNHENNLKRNNTVGNINAKNVKNVNTSSEGSSY